MCVQGALHARPIVPESVCMLFAWIAVASVLVSEPVPERLLDAAAPQIARGELSLALEILAQASPAERRLLEKSLGARAKAASGLDEQLRYALLESALANADQPKERRPYLRRALLAATCQRYDKAKGAGACALTALRSLGEPANLVDPSLGRALTRALGDQDIARAHTDGLALIKDCLVAASKDNAELFENGTVVIDWAIDPNGRAIDIAVEPRRFNLLVGACVAERLSYLRYPRSTSAERKAVSLSYQLATVDRYTLVQE
jgi:hypothetical protein